MATPARDSHDVLGDLVRGSLDHCVKCTICETFCPVSNVTPLFPGPKYVGPQAERFRVDDDIQAVLRAIVDDDGEVERGGNTAARTLYDEDAGQPEAFGLQPAL